LDAQQYGNPRRPDGYDGGYSSSVDKNTENRVMASEPRMSDETRRLTDKVRRSWAKQASHYDKSIGFFERRVFGAEHRKWACVKASGDTLEVAVGTALNLPHFPEAVRLTGLDLSPEMLAIARNRASEIGSQVALLEGDAHALPFAESAFDSVVCTYSLCNIPDPRLAVSEMKRVLRVGGRLILVDHIRSPVKVVYWTQKSIEFFTGRLAGEHMTRRPLDQVKAEGLEVIERDRLGPGAVIERLVAIKSSPREMVPASEASGP
jgi:ubiquinone/menaquinone biosynthesis C-methylase UbiE